MSDFFQTGAIARLHRPGRPDPARLERELEEFSDGTLIALILPCHIKELGTTALKRIMHELAQVKYLAQIIVGIDKASKRDG
jgi:glucosyl-3-phosphoglycerate synthase